MALISFQPSLLRSFARTSAWQGWEAIHEQPAKAFVCSVLATLNTILVNTWVLIFVSRPLRWSHHALSLAYIAVHATTLLLVWINGPSIAKTTAYYTCFNIAVFIQIGVSARLVLGPDEHVPFRNRLVFELVNAFTQWTWNLASLLGCWAADHPRRPHRWCIVFRPLPCVEHATWPRSLPMTYPAVLRGAHALGSVCGRIIK